MEITTSELDDLLRYASDIAADRTNPGPIAADAFAMLDWAEQDGGRDAETRMKAIRRAWDNTTGAPVDVQTFLAAADIYYGFLSACRMRPDNTMTCAPDEVGSADQRLLRYLASKPTGWAFRPGDVHDEARSYVDRSRAWIRTAIITYANEGRYVERIHDPESPNDCKYQTLEAIGLYRVDDEPVFTIDGKPVVVSEEEL